jgi:PTS system glucitol/sorbitol-specific IIC component
MKAGRFFMILINGIQEIVKSGAGQLVTWITELLPELFLFLIMLNAATSLIGRARVERLAAKCGSNAILRYMLLPFLSAIVLGNPMAISMGRYLPERCKPAYFASASYHCHTNSGVFQHINPAELFLWLGIANGVMAKDLDLFPLAIRYMAAGLLANFVSGYVTELVTRRVEKKQGIRLDRKVDLWVKKEGEKTAELAAKTAQEPTEKPVGKTTSADACSKPGYHAITITRGDGGYGGPVTVTPTEERHIVLYMTGGGMEPEPLARIVELSGMTAVNGNLETCPDEEVALAIIDCGGTLRCGIYPGKGIPTVNILATGKSGPLAKYMTPDLYVSAVTSACVAAAEADGAVCDAEAEEDSNAFVENARKVETSSDTYAANAKKTETCRAARPLEQILQPVLTVSKVISLFQQSAREAVRTCLEMILPFMGFAALFIGICKGTGLTEFLADLIKPMGGSLPGLMGLGIICSIPGLSAILGAGAMAAQMFSTVIGELIAAGSIPPEMALPALFAINCQCACDFIPVGLGMTEAKPETTQVGIAAVTISRFITGWIRILIAIVFSIGLYR